jgi:tubulin polyglutamylase TTLL9
MWADREWVYEVSDSMRLESWQKLNHFRNGRELCRKDLLVKNLKRKKATPPPTPPSTYVVTLVK